MFFFLQFRPQQISSLCRMRESSNPTSARVSVKIKIPIFYLFWPGQVDSSVLSSTQRLFIGLRVAPSVMTGGATRGQLFIDLCFDFGMLNADDSFWPASEITLLRFISYLSSRDYKLCSIKRLLVSQCVPFTFSKGFSNPLENKPRIYGGPQLSQQQQITHSTNQNVHSNNK